MCCASRPAIAIGEWRATRPSAPAPTKPSGRRAAHRARRRAPPPQRTGRRRVQESRGLAVAWERGCRPNHPTASGGGGKTAVAPSQRWSGQRRIQTKRMSRGEKKLPYPRI